MSYYKIGPEHTSWGSIDENGVYHEIGTSDTIHLFSLADQPPHEIIGAFRVDDKTLSVTYTFTAVDQPTFHKLVRVLGLDMLYNAWRKVARKFAGKN